MAKVIVGIIAALGAALLLACMGCIIVPEFFFHLAFGWVLFLIRVIPEIQVNLGSVLSAIVCLGGLGFGLHYFLRWSYSQRQSLGVESPAPRQWQLRWTLSLLAVVVLMFVAGVSAVGITHQTTWLLTSPEPMASGGIRVVAARSQSTNHLKQIGNGLHNHNDKFNQMPPGCTVNAEGNMLHGWQTLLLPYVEQDALYRQIDLQVPWHHPKNAPSFRTIVRTYQSPGVNIPFVNELAASHYAGNVRVLGAEVGRALPKDIPDGMTNTILAGEAAGNYRPWGHPMNWRDPAKGLHRSPDGFGGPFRQGTLFLMCDGGVRVIKNDVSPEVLKALSTPNGGEIIPDY